MTRPIGRGLFALTCLAVVVVCVVAAFTLPARVPIHFDAAGAPDNYGSRATALGSFVGVGVLMVGIFALTAWSARRIPLRWVNIPHKEWWTETPARESRLRKLVEDDLWVLGAITMAFIAAVIAFTLVAAHQAHPSLGWPFFGALVLYGVGTVWQVIRMFRRYRPDRESGATP